MHGFRAFCVKTGCTEVVSGKTSVVDADVVEFLVWYDNQPPNVSMSAAEMKVLSSASLKRPGDADVKLKMDGVKERIRELQVSGEPDEPCDLLRVAQLARKPY